MKNSLSTENRTFIRILFFVLLITSLSCNLSKATGSPIPTSSGYGQETEIILPLPGSSAYASPSLIPTSIPSPDVRPTDRPTTQIPEEPLPLPTPVENVEIVLSTCPTESELERFNTDFHILFDSAIAFPPYDCQNGTGPGGEVNPKLVLFQGLRVIHALQFNQPLPWTELSLYEWLKGAIHGIVITDVEYSYCCEAGNEIVLKGELLSQTDYQAWANPQSGVGLMSLVGLIVHEARHAEIGGHTCGSDDLTLEELGAWGVQYYLFLYMVENSAPDFFTQEQRQVASQHADTALARICNP